MRRIIDDRYELVDGRDHAAHAEAVRFTSTSSARTFLARWLVRPSSMAVLRSALARHPGFDVSSCGDGEVLDALARRLSSGLLRIVERPRPQLNARPGEQDELGAGPSSVRVLEPEPAWIEFEVFDERGRPLAAEPYEIELPGGERRKGTLDGEGFARLEPLPPGQCKLIFPKRDKLDWDPSIERFGTSRRTWIEIELLDADGKPCADERFVVTKPDGSIVEGTLDAQGLARVEGVVPGECGVRFPVRDWRDMQALAR